MSNAAVDDAVIEAPEPEARSDKALMAEARKYATEDRAKSWFALFSTIALAFGLGAVAALAPYWPVRVVAALFQGLTIVRLFIIYHDYMHGAILRRSWLAKAILYTYGVLVMTPPNVWRDTHNYHHANTAKIVGSHIGSYVMVTTGMWQRMKPRERFMYRVVRHPVTILLGYFTIFMLGMCLSPFLRAPKKNWDSALALVVNFAITALAIRFFGFELFFFAYFLPLAVATASGAYLFYAQHNFPEAYIQPREQWSYTRAALESSSYMKMGALMNYFTGNIGFHHVHHLNQQIPFYRLPQAMAAIPELQHPPTTSLSPKDILLCFRQKLWDPGAKRMVGYPS